MVVGITKEAGESTPAIQFDPDEGKLVICGESYPEDTFDFYNPLMEALQAFLDTSPEVFHVEVELVYFNSSTSKVLMDLFDMLEDAADDGAAVTVDWRYHAENDVAQENGEEFREDLDKVEFNLIEFTD